MAARKDSARPLVGGVGISSHQRVIDEASGTTKLGALLREQPPATKKAVLMALRLMLKTRAY